MVVKVGNEKKEKRQKKRQGKRSRQLQHLNQQSAEFQVLSVPKPTIPTLRPGQDVTSLQSESTKVEEQVTEKTVVLVDHSSEQIGKKKRKREERKQALIQNKLWRSFDRKSDHANPFFAKFYREQLNLHDEEEWKRFIEVLGQNLRVTFRLNRSKFPIITKTLEKRLETEFRFPGKFIRVGSDQVIDSKDVVNGSPWFESVYMLGTDRSGFAKAETLEPLHTTIEREARLGHCARQGIASMLPAVVLQPKPNDIVLDMCAAPGSKTEQLLQMMGTNSQGVVVSNDSDPKRLESLTRRFESVPRKNLLVTCSRGEDLYKAFGSEQFDSIICDVPCSGDGTIRKYPHLWKIWRAKRGAMLHPLQLQLAKSAASLLKVGGRMVYSTCSISPIEDEAVVSALLKASKGSLRLVPIELGSFQTRPGLHTWNASEDLLREGEFEEDEEDAQGQDAQGDQSEQQAAKRKKLAKKHKRKNGKKKGFERVQVCETMLPPSKKEAAKMKLEACARILHHDNDTEGFFIALIEKVAPWELSDEDPSPESNATKDSLSAKKAKAVLRTVGFNPRLATDAQAIKDSRWFESKSEDAAVASMQIVHQFGASSNLLNSHRILFQTMRKEQVRVHLVSAALAKLITMPWYQQGKVPVFSAGVAIAEADCSLKKDLSLVSCGSFLPSPHGALDYAFELSRESNAKSVLLEIEPIQFFAFLQLAMQAIQDQEESPTNTGVHLSLRSCIEILDEDSLDSDDEDEDRQLPAAVVDPDLLQNPMAEKLARADSNTPVFITVPTKSLLALVQAAEEEQQAEKEKAAAMPKRLSAAEKRRMKKQKKKNNNNNQQKTNAKAAAEVEQPKQGAPLTKEKIDMFAGAEEAPFEMVLAFHKISETSVRVLSDFDLITSFGQAMQTLIPHEDVSDDEAEEEDQADMSDE